MKNIKKNATLLTLVAFSISLYAKDKSPIKGWSFYESEKGTYKTGLATIDGKTAVYIEADKTKPYTWGNLYMERFKADKYLGKRIRLSGEIKTENVKGWAGLFLSAIGDSNSIFTYNKDYQSARKIKGTNEWKTYSEVVDVPINGVSIGISFTLDSTGKAWFANLKLEVVDSTVPLTSKKWAQNNWETYGQYYTQFKDGIDTINKFNGIPVYYCKAKDSARKDIFVAQYRSALGCLGKKVKITTYIKSDNLRYTEYYTLTVSYKKNNHSESYGASHYICKKIKKTQDWTKYETVLYIPENSVGIEYFIDMDKSGEVWASRPTIEIVDDNTPTTDKKEKKFPAQPLFADGPTLDFVTNSK